MNGLDGVDRLLIDGNNLLHRTSGSVDPGAQRLLLARLSGAIPPTIPTVLMLDGHAASGTDRRQRVRRGLEIHHSGSLSADDALLLLIRDVAPRDRARLTLVSDDRSLYEKARHLGAQTQRLAWLESLLDRPAGAGRPVQVGAGKPPPQQSPGDSEREPWKPGRGATTKRGNPRRGRRS
jgi:hypothetical protein